MASRFQHNTPTAIAASDDDAYKRAPLESELPLREPTAPERKGRRNRKEASPTSPLGSHNVCLAYLWYFQAMTKDNMTHYTGLKATQCYTKRDMFPNKLPQSLMHDDALDEKARNLISGKKSFSELEDTMVSRGTKTAKAVYEIWADTYAERTWLDEDIKTLSELIQTCTISGRVNWRRISDEMHGKGIFVTPKQCKTTYETHLKEPLKEV